MQINCVWLSWNAWVIAGCADFQAWIWSNASCKRGAERHAADLGLRSSQIIYLIKFVSNWETANAFVESVKIVCGAQMESHTKLSRLFIIVVRQMEMNLEFNEFSYGIWKRVKENGGVYVYESPLCFLSIFPLPHSFIPSFLFFFSLSLSLSLFPFFYF